jgi:hypothetical protein
MSEPPTTLSETVKLRLVEVCAALERRRAQGLDMNEIEHYFGLRTSIPVTTVCRTDPIPEGHERTELYL